MTQKVNIKEVLKHYQLDNIFDRLKENVKDKTILLVNELDNKPLNYDKIFELIELIETTLKMAYTYEIGESIKFYF